MDWPRLLVVQSDNFDLRPDYLKRENGTLFIRAKFYWLRHEYTYGRGDNSRGNKGITAWVVSNDPAQVPGTRPLVIIIREVQDL